MRLSHQARHKVFEGAGTVKSRKHMSAVYNVICRPLSATQGRQATTRRCSSTRERSVTYIALICPHGRPSYATSHGKQTGYREELGLICLGVYVQAAQCLPYEDTQAATILRVHCLIFADSPKCLSKRRVGVLEEHLEVCVEPGASLRSRLEGGLATASSIVTNSGLIRGAVRLMIVSASVIAGYNQC